jgi:hypothetical protein
MVDRPQETGWEGDLVPGQHRSDGGSQDDFLQVDRDAVPGLRGAFVDALARVDRQLELVDKELRVTSWAKDPVSVGATTIFNNRSLDADENAAVDLLRSYREQLDAAVTNLDMTAKQYDTIDSETITGVGKHDQG